MPWVTAAVSGLAAGAFAASQLTADPSSSAGALGHVLAVIQAGARSTSLVADTGEGWRLLSCHFVHTSATHLLFNLAFLFPVGGAVEQVLHRRDYVALLLALALGSSLASLWWTPQVSAGASGLVFGLLGAAVALGLRHGPRMPAAVRVHFGPWVLPFLVIVLLVTARNPAVDHGSHLGGLGTGLVLGLMLPLRIDVRRSWRIASAAAATAVTIVLAPQLAIRGDTATRFVLDDGTSVRVPARWRARYGPVGELEFVSAGGVVVLSTDRAPAASADEQRNWYAEHRLAPLVPSGRVQDIEWFDAAPVRAPHARGHWTRVGFRRDGVQMVRDIYFLVPDPMPERLSAPVAERLADLASTATDAPRPAAVAGPRDPARSGGPTATVLALELPRAWAGKYEETRRAIVGSLKAPPRASETPRHRSLPPTAAALQ